VAKKDAAGPDCCDRERVPVWFGRQSKSGIITNVLLLALE
jgi:hypothetical protein